MKTQFKTPQFANEDFLQALRTSNLELVKDLVINHGADVNALDQSRVPVFAHAIMSGKQEMIDFFLSQGAKVNPEYGNVIVTPLGAACALAARADTTDNINYTFGKLFDLGAEINPTHCNSSPLVEVIRANGACSPLIAQYLVKKLGAEINPTGDYNITPLTTATQIAVNTGKLDLFSICLNLGAKIDPINSTQLSPLVTAIQSDSLNAKIIAEYFIDSGASLGRGNERLYNSSIHQAVMHSKKEIYEMLISKGMDVNYKVNTCSPFEYAISLHNFDMAEFILTKYGKDVHISKDIFKQCMILQKTNLIEAFVKNGFDYTDECATTIKRSDSKILQAIINQYDEYPPAEHPQFSYGEFVIRTLDPTYSNESDRPDNLADKKVVCRLSVKDGLIFDKNGNQFSTEDVMQATNNIYLWVLDRHGELYSCTMRGEISGTGIGNQHSFFSKKDGFGKPIACGGHFKVQDGKIIEIDPQSGHYKPTKDQLILAVKFLHKKGVLSDEIEIQYFDDQLKTIPLQEIIDMDAASILSKYQTLEGYTSSKIQVIEVHSLETDNLDITNTPDHAQIQLSGEDYVVDNSDAI